MKAAHLALGTNLLLVSLMVPAPARADFKYTESSQVTGGSLVKMMKVASIFARGDAKKQEQQAMQPTSTTHYVKGDRLRTDNADGTSQVIDLASQRVIAIDNNKKTYAIATFDQIRAAMQQAMQNAQQQQPQAQQGQQAPQNPQVTITPTVKVTPGTSNRVILSQSTNETKVEMDITMQATGTGPNAPPPGQPNSATMTTTMDTFVAPGVAGYQEFAQFYRHMAQQANWITLPSNVHVTDPRVSQSMASLQQNSDALKGFPMLSYVNMGMVANGQPDTSQTAAQNQNSTPPSSNSSNNSSNSSVIDSPSAAITKGLGGLFGRKKQQNQDNSNQNSNASSQSAPPPNPNANPNDLIEITTQVTTFSDSSLDAGLFDVPAGYMQIQVDPTLVMAGRSSQQ